MHSTTGGIHVNRMIFAAAGSAACAYRVLAGASFTTIDLLPGGTSLLAYAVSDDGTVVVGTGGSSGGQRGFRWTRDTGATIIEPLIGADDSSAFDISGDGSVVIGDTLVDQPLGFRPYIWTSEGGYQTLPLPDGAFFAAAYGVNRDGSVVVGTTHVEPQPSAETQAVRWRGAQDYQLLGVLPGTWRSSAAAVNDRGDVIVGLCPRFDGQLRAFRWSEDTGMQQLRGFQAEDVESQALDISGSGDVIVGSIRGDAGAFQAAVWLNEGTLAVDLGTLPGFESSVVTATNSAGTAFVGHAAVGDVTHAVYWNESFETIDLNVWLPLLGVDLEGWLLTSARDISGDGTTLIGEGYLDGVRRPWVVTIPSPGAAGMLAVAMIATARRRR